MLTETLLVASLLLPAPGTASRERDFCRAWLELSPPQQYDQLRAAAPGGAAGSCQEGLARALRSLEYECRNWRLLMDFEVRGFLDDALAGCDP